MNLITSHSFLSPSFFKPAHYGWAAWEIFGIYKSLECFKLWRADHTNITFLAYIYIYNFLCKYDTKFHIYNIFL